MKVINGVVFPSSNTPIILNVLPITFIIPECFDKFSMERGGWLICHPERS
ncbi:MAG: hypothetical protein AB7S48_16960 [Bacteroidales bacterium]